MRRHRLVHLVALFIVTMTALQMMFSMHMLPSIDGGNGNLAPFQNTNTASFNSQTTIHHKNTPFRHAIPRNLIFTHYKNLLDTQAPDHLDEEEKYLAENIQHSIEVHRNESAISILFLQDKECIESLQRVYPSLIPFFQNETEGMYKADICRGAALYKNGGLYLDVDIGVRHSLFKDLRTSTEFVTARVHRQSNYPGHFFQAILGATPRSPILLRYLRLFEKHYTGTDRVKKGPLGVILLKRAWDQVTKTNRSLRTRTELYQEVLYDRNLFPDLHPSPTWGTRRACHFVVVATANSRANVEFRVPTNDDDVMKLHIPVLSRVPGSRMCPDEIDGKKPDKKWWERD
jgi:hypothetical protein